MSRTKTQLTIAEEQATLELKEVRAQMKLLEVKEAKAKQILAKLPAGVKFLTADGTAITRCESERVTHSWDIVKAQAPDLYEQASSVSTTTSYRVN